MTNTIPLADITPTTKFLACKDVICAELGGEMSLLQMKTGVYFTLNSLASAIWKRMSTPASLLELQDFILANYDVSPEQSEKDVRQLFQRLLSEHLIEVAV